MLKIIVVHVDDESHLVEQIPEQVRLTFYLDHPDYDVGELNVTETEDGVTVYFDLKCPDGKSYIIEYRIVATLPQDGWEQVDVAIFDYLRVNNDGELVPFDVSEILAVIAKIGRQKVFIFTGYPEEATEALRSYIEEDNFITKPGDSLWIAEQIVSKILESISEKIEA